MSSLDNLREEINDVFKIFDEEESGSISLRELARALHTITGERISRMEVLKLLLHAREVVSEKHRRREKSQQSLQTDAIGLETKQGIAKSHEASDLLFRPNRQSENSNLPKDPLKSSSTDLAKIEYDSSQSQYLSSRSQKHLNSDGIDIEVFEQVVMRKLNSRSQQEELSFAFQLLEDKACPGYITKESLTRVAAETGEPLTDAEVCEMFDVAVTGVPTPAVDFNTFSIIQSAARKIEIE